MANIFWFYVVLFVTILLIKKIRHTRIILNTIWFSSDGSVSDDAVNNLKQLSLAIKDSAYKRDYQLIFWTDSKKLNPSIKKIFHQHEIKIKDYRSAFLRDGEAEKNKMISLLSLAGQSNKIFYVLASDILRFYLLLKAFPVWNPNAIICYIDCNDICLANIPNPNKFKKLEALAFHFINFNHCHHDIFSRLIEGGSYDQLLLTNDVIVSRASKANRLLFSKIFSTYFRNLEHNKPAINEMLDALMWTQKVMGYLDDDLVIVMIFTTTHMQNVLYAYQERIYLLDFSEGKLKIEEIKHIHNAEDYIEFERDYSKGLTCFHRDPAHEFEALITAEKERCRQFWHQLFLQRYELTNALFPRIQT